jgi:hypothetical protein
MVAAVGRRANIHRRIFNFEHVASNGAIPAIRTHRTSDLVSRLLQRGDRFIHGEADEIREVR